MRTPYKIRKTSQQEQKVSVKENTQQLIDFGTQLVLAYKRSLFKGFKVTFTQGQKKPDYEFVITVFDENNRRHLVITLVELDMSVHGAAPGTTEYEAFIGGKYCGPFETVLEMSRYIKTHFKGFYI